MITTERESEGSTNEKRLYFKELRLITPELANELEINAESPVFISPMVNGDEKCSHCGVTYRPLIYGTGSIVLPHHFHPPRLFTPYGEDGGVYIFGTDDSRVQAIFGGWIALVEPQGDMGFQSAEKVFVKGISAFCMPECCGRELSEGIVVTPDDRFLIPSCGDLEKLSERDVVKYNFKIVDGQVLFSEPQGTTL